MGAACINGTCANFLPQEWRSIAIDQATGADSTYSSSPPTCAVGHECTLWKVTPDGAVEKSAAGLTTSTTLSATDLAAFDAIARSVSFRAAFWPSIDVTPTVACDPAPAGIRVSIDLENASGTTGADLTGCALVGPASNDVKRLYDIVSAY